MERESIITRLNSWFPRLSVLHECLLVLAGIITVAYTVLNYASMGSWAVAPGLMLMRFSWREPPLGRERYKWAVVTGLFGLMLAGAVYLDLSLRVARL